MNFTGRSRLRLGACLSLSGRYARFGSQCALGLQTWQELDGGAELRIEDDASDPAQVGPALQRLASTTDLLLGPYSTQLMRAAARFVQAADVLLWNHGGSGDDVQDSAPRRIVSVLSPASRYAVPFLCGLGDGKSGVPLWIAGGRTAFGRQVAAGAESRAMTLGLAATRLGPDQPLPSWPLHVEWDLFCGGQFEEDVARIREARALERPPRLLCAVAAGVHDLATVVDDPKGLYGVAQWAPGGDATADVGPAAQLFLARYRRLARRSLDYPAVQAAATAALAVHCARVSGSAASTDLWRLAAGLDTSTLFGRFKIDPLTGAQVAHQMLPVRWTALGPELVEQVRP
ncbi:MAG: hypothetical protein M3024_15705 [Candidatus Dormibacteraeota bacterium]|nr:hypothetical protein [Candidatus Dormibacteraeota bacterium]